MIRTTCPVPGGTGVPPWGCHGFLHWLMHGAGVDTQTSYAYDFFSGVGPFLVGLSGWIVVIGAGIAWYRHWNCHATWWCWRHARHPLTDPGSGETHLLCWRHHPGQRHKRWSLEHIQGVWERSAHARRAGTQDGSPVDGHSRPGS